MLIVPPIAPIRVLCVATALMLVSLDVASAQEGRATDADATDGSLSAISFELDIQPILTASGCNSGACHGKQRGQNGFQLSLLGFDADFDFAALTRDTRGRRLFPASPRESLLLQKATSELPHGGGRRVELDSADYQTLVAWIVQGSPRRVIDEPALIRVSLDQDSFSLTPSAQDRLRVTAHYSDQSTRDVTRLTGFLSNDDAVASVKEDGTIVAGPLPGETAVMARYMNQICVAEVAIPQTAPLPEGAFDSLPQYNFIDELVDAKLQSLSIEPSPVVSDNVFLRRVSVDLIGRLPTVEEARAFLDSADPNKREVMVDKLLAQREYADHWATFWADLLRPNPYRVGIKAVLNYDNWIRQQFRDNVPYDQFVRQLITAKGSTWHNGATTMYRDRRSPDEIATMTSQLFLGIRLDCAKCHHHPFERWSQSDFYQFAAYFAKVGYKGTGLSPPISGGEETVFTSQKGSVQHPLSGETMLPTPLYGESTSVGDDVDPRLALADWMTSKENDYFAKVQVNRVWAILMGRGLVEPVDDLRTTNPPTNPALLDALASEFQSTNYDLKQLLKTIVLSRVYSHSSLPTPSNVSDRLNYSRHYRKRLRAEVMLDAITDVTETTAELSEMPPETRARQVWTTRVNSIFLDTFGRPNENQDPPCERIPEATVSQSLHLMNSPQLEGRIRSDGSRAARLAQSTLTPPQITDELYLAIYSRHPTDKEREAVVGIIEAAENRRGVLEDLMWAMINSPEFSILD
jgi:hypothetical protein